MVWSTPFRRRYTVLFEGMKVSLMSNLWDKTIEVSQDQVKDLIFSQFNINVESLSIIGEGYDNTAFLINNNLVFRFPHREMGVLCLNNELAILPFLAKKLSFPFSHPIFIGEPTDEFPHPFAGYPLLQGSTLTSFQQPLMDNVDFAAILGRWLKELHDVPVIPDHRDHIQGDQKWRLNVQNRETRLKEQTTQYAVEFEEAGFSIQQLLDTFNKLKENYFIEDRTCYLHGDIYSRHIIVNDQGMPAGLIDWGDLHIGHPGIDLSCALMIFSNNAFKVFAAQYGGIDLNTLAIAQFRAFCHAAMALPYTIIMEDPAFKAWTIAALQNVMERIKK